MAADTRPSLPATDPDERWSALEQLDEWLRTPMLVLSFVWLVLVVVELVWGGGRATEVLGLVIWGVFVAEFALRFTLAPAKLPFLRHDWITILALLAPALQMIRVFRAARSLRGLRLVRIVGTANRGMNALRAGLRRRGFGYVAGLTVIVALLGAAVGGGAHDPNISSIGRLRSTGRNDRGPGTIDAGGTSGPAEPFAAAMIEHL